MEVQSDEACIMKTGEGDDNPEIGGKSTSSSSSSIPQKQHQHQHQQQQEQSASQLEKCSSPSSVNQSTSSIDLLADESMNESKNSSASDEGGKKMDIDEPVVDLVDKSVTLHPIATNTTIASNHTVVTIQPASISSLSSSSSSSLSTSSITQQALSSITSTSSFSTLPTPTSVTIAPAPVTHIIPPASALISSIKASSSSTSGDTLSASSRGIVTASASSSSSAISVAASSTIPSTNQASAASNTSTTVNPTLSGPGIKFHVVNAPGKIDSIQIIKWKDGVGTLPGSKLKFKLNEYGTLEMLCDDEHVKITEKPTSNPIESVRVPAESSNGSNSSNSNNNNDLSITPLAECVNCKRQGVKSSFIRNGRFCSQSCATKQSENLKIFSKSSASNSAPIINNNSNTNVLNQAFLKKPTANILYGQRVFVDISSSDKIRIRKPFLLPDRSDLHGIGRSETPDGLDLIDANEEVENLDSSIGIRNVLARRFNWKEYLEEQRSICSPIKCFKENQTFPSIKNNFKHGMKLEGVDPHNPALYCVLTVAEVVGFRLRLHFDGYPDIYDFWVNADSPFIFPAGWCQKTGRKLEPPKELVGNFSWNSYLQTTKAQAAPKELFTCFKTNSTFNNFRVGHKLEAVDKAVGDKDSDRNKSVCVATVADVLDNYILVHFDGWDDSYDYWISISSPYIHPIDWCNQKNRPLIPPKDYPKSNEKFKWFNYLTETKTVPAPNKAFRLRKENSFRVGMKCEVVDKRYPRFIRVATIVERKPFSVKIHFDGWDHKYDFWLDDDSPDMHPVNWCAKTHHPLQPPPQFIRKNVELYNCHTPGCSGFGTTKSTRFSFHHSSVHCPYSDENRERELPDRFGRDFSDDELNPKSPLVEELSCPASPSSFSDMRRKRKRKRENSGSSGSDSAKLSRPSTPSSFFHNSIQNSKNHYSATISTLHQAIYSLRMNPQQSSETPIAWEKHSKSLLSFAEKVSASDVLRWGPQKVAQFVSAIPGCQDFGQCFEEEMIDGEAFLLLNQTDLVTHLGIKLGPAVKIYNSILVIRDNIEA